MPNETYQAVKLEQIKNETITRIYGRPLDSGEQLDVTDPTNADSRIAVQWCLCVQDSPESPCHCLPLIIWLGRRDVIHLEKTDQKDHAGETLYYFDLKNDATLLLDRVQPISTSTAKRLVGMSHADVETLLDASTKLAGVPLGGVAEFPVVVVLEGIAAALEILSKLSDWGVFDSIDVGEFVKGHQH
jgi:hypothetical protein